MWQLIKTENGKTVVQDYEARMRGSRWIWVERVGVKHECETPVATGPAV